MPAGFLTLLPLLPLTGLLARALAGARLPARQESRIACGGSIAALLVALWGLGDVGDGGDVTSSLGEWIRAGEFSIEATLRLDLLSAAVAAVIAVIAVTAQVDTVLAGRDWRATRRSLRWIAVLTSAVLIATLADNLMVVFLGWEILSLAIFSLARPARRARRALVLGLVGDGCLLLAALLASFGSPTSMSSLDLDVGSNAAWIAWLAWVGALARCAQVPFHFWLHSRFRGPSVATLVHASASLTGVLILARLDPVLGATGAVSALAAGLGIASAGWALLHATSRRDREAVLSDSTTGILALAFLAAAAGDSGAAVFVALVHALVKAVLILSSGLSVPSLKAGVPSQRGGWLFPLGAAALAGVPPGPGFFAYSQVASSMFGRAFDDGVQFGWLLCWVLTLLCCVLCGVAAVRLVTLPGNGSSRAPTVKPVCLWGLALLALAAGLLPLSGIVGESGGRDGISWLLVALCAADGVWLGYRSYGLRQRSRARLLVRWRLVLGRVRRHATPLRVRSVELARTLRDLAVYVVDRALLDRGLVSGSGWCARALATASDLREPPALAARTVWLVASLLVVLAVVLLGGL